MMILGMLRIYYHFMFMDAWPAHMSLIYAYARCLKKVLEDVQFPGTEVTVVNLLVGAGI